MGSFDIQNLLQFPSTLACCKKCLAISPTLKLNHKQQAYCPTCKVSYVTPGKLDPSWIRDYFRSKDLYIHDKQIFEHCRQLAVIAH
jgi:uncharacterized paraquat-inducible protein A